MGSANRWSIVLAAGEGSRLRSVTTGADGVAVPKQYFRGPDGRLPLEVALERAGRVVSDKRVVTVVAAEHGCWWSRDLGSRPAESVVVQPRNKGTAAGILLPLLHVLHRDPDALVLFTPADHHVQDEGVLTRAADRAFEALESDVGEQTAVVLLGMQPDAPVTDYGWIVPGTPSPRAVKPVRRFMEKPDAQTAAALHARGALWNSFLFVARGRELLRLFARQQPALLDGMLRALSSREDGAVDRLYAQLQTRDFSRHVLQGAERWLRVLAVPPCGWTDMGTPDRYAECFADAATHGFTDEPAQWSAGDRPSTQPARARHRQASQALMRRAVGDLESVR